MSPCISPISYLPASVFFCQYLLLGTCWCLYGLNSFQYLSRELNWCMPEVFPNVLCQVCLSFSANACYEEPADVYLDWTRVSSCQYLSSEFNRCLPEVFPNVFCQVCLKGSLDVFLDQPNIFLASVCLMGLISVCPSWFSPVSFCQCLLWGTCWCLSGLSSRVFLSVSF